MSVPELNVVFVKKKINNKNKKKLTTDDVGFTCLISVIFKTPKCDLG